MAMLKSIHIQGFKSIRDARVELGRVNVLIGANAGGKSNLVAFFRLLRAVGAGYLRHFVAQAGGSEQLLRYGSKTTPQTGGRVELDDGNGDIAVYEFELRAGDTEWLWFRFERLYHSNSSGPVKLEGESIVGDVESRLGQLSRAEITSPSAGQVSEALTRLAIFQFQDTTSTAGIRRSVYVDQNSSMMPDGSNLAAVLHKFSKVKPAFYRRIVATVRQVFPQFADFVLEPDALAPTQIKLNWRELGQDALFGPHQLSDGTLRFIALATLLLQPEEELPKVIVIDEPELGLHPYAIGVLASLITAASRYCQVIVATQSVTLLDQFDMADVIVVERDRVHNATEFRRLNADELAVWKDEYENPISLGELWERNIIGGGPH